MLLILMLIPFFSPPLSLSCVVDCGGWLKFEGLLGAAIMLVSSKAGGFFFSCGGGGFSKLCVCEGVVKDD